MTAASNGPARPRQEISAWLAEWIANELKMPAADIDPARSLLEYSMSSLTATILIGDLEDWLQLRLPPTLVWDYTSIDAMTDYLLEQAAQKEGSAAPAAAPLAAEGTDDAQQLLEELDKLSDEEVDALLNRITASERSNA